MVKFLNGHHKDMVIIVPAKNVKYKEDLNINMEEECMQPFEDIENMTLERFYNNYINSKGDR